MFARNNKQIYNIPQSLHRVPLELYKVLCPLFLKNQPNDISIIAVSRAMSWIVQLNCKCFHKRDFQDCIASCPLMSTSNTFITYIFGRTAIEWRWKKLMQRHVQFHPALYAQCFEPIAWTSLLLHRSAEDVLLIAVIFLYLGPVLLFTRIGPLLWWVLYYGMTLLLHSGAWCYRGYHLRLSVVWRLLFSPTCHTESASE